MEWDQAKIIEACIKKDKRAQKALFHHYKRQLMGLCLRYTNTREMAEEILMDSFVAIFKNIHTCNTETFESWMKSIVVHKAVDYYRSHINDLSTDDLESLEGQIKTQKNPNTLEEEELLTILQQLPAGYRLVFNLYAIEGYRHKEIAEKLKISENTSKSQYRKAKARLQHLLEEGGYHG
jgi:RNA polymerase sigma factor (sigma-70 family)